MREESDSKADSASNLLDSYGKDKDDVIGVMFADVGSASGKSSGGRQTPADEDEPTDDLA
jgi:hypothetical protein